MKGSSGSCAPAWRLLLVLLMAAGGWPGADSGAWAAGSTRGKGAGKETEKGNARAVGPVRGEKGEKKSTGGKGEAVILSKRVDPAQYVLGPGDSLVINLWGEYDEVYEQTVSAEGKISLPTIGELMVSGETLARAEARLGVEVRKYYRNVQSGISLLGLRQFKVAVLGAVQEPGSYPATLDMRVSDVVAL